jgi:hypothetical protein
MKSDDPRLPIKGASFGLVTHYGVSDVFDRLAVSFICGRPLGKRFCFGGERLAAFGHMSGLT